MAPEANAPKGGKHQRKLRNYLLDPSFQLKYAGLLVAIAVLLSLSLGALFWFTGDLAMRQSSGAVAEAKEANLRAGEAVRLGQVAVKFGQGLVKESQTNSNLVKMRIETDYADQPEMAKKFASKAKKRDQELHAQARKLEVQAKKLQADAAQLRARTSNLEAQSMALRAQQVLLRRVLVASLLGSILLLGFAGIVITHKIAGPIFKMKRQIRELGEGTMRMPSPLRKGDELVHFFETFEATVSSLRKRQAEEISKLDRAIADLESRADNRESLSSLRALRKDMQAELE